MAAFPLPAVFWHCYDHPDRRPDPDRETALAAPVAAFPSWYVRVICGGCGTEKYINQIGLLLAGWSQR
jgi:hypothetical protein